jgi:hypothetical protein
MNRKLTLLICGILSMAVSINTHGQAAGNAVYNQVLNGKPGGGQIPVDLNVIPISSYSFGNMLEANVLMNVRATAFTAIFSLTQNAKTVEEAEGMMKNRTEIFKQQMTAAQIQESQIFIDPVSLVPTYETEIINKKLSKTLNEVATGFEMKKNIHITFYKHGQINDIVTAAARAEVYDLVKVEYAIENMDELVNKMRQDALQILLIKKGAMEKLGIFARYTRMGEKVGSAYPFERYNQYTAFKTGTAPGFIAQHAKNQTVQQVVYNYAEKNKTIYYDKVSEKQFDRVVNPVVDEPMVQLYVSVKAEYQVYDPEQEKEGKEAVKKQKAWDDAEMDFKLKERKLDIDHKYPGQKTTTLQKPKSKTNATSTITIQND